MSGRAEPRLGFPEMLSWRCSSLAGYQNHVRLSSGIYSGSAWLGRQSPGLPTMRLEVLITLLLLSLSCLPAQPGPSYGRRHSRRYRGRAGRGGRGGRGWSGGGGGGNKIAVGTQCRLVKQSGGGGGGQCFQEEECGQVCSTVSQTQCSTVSESQCSTVSVPQCRSHLL